MIEDYLNWTGNRQELISLIKLFEEFDSKLYKMFSKQLGKVSSVNERRIQQFIDEQIIPKPDFEEKKYVYNSGHLVRYLCAIILRNKGYPLKIIKENLDANDFEFLKNEFVKGNTDDKFLYKQNFEHVDLRSRLKKLGRNEGRVLEINQKKLAITPWLTVLINEKQLNKLSENDIDTITEALSNSLKTTIKKKK